MASIEKLEPGKYEIRWRTPEGKSRRKIIRDGPEQARRFARNIEAAKDRGSYIDRALARQRLHTGQPSGLTRCVRR